MASVQILHGVVSLYGMRIGERAASMFTAICRDLDRVFQRVNLLVLWLICSGRRADPDDEVGVWVAKCRSGRSSRRRWYAESAPRFSMPGLDFPKRSKTMINKEGAPNIAPERRALTIFGDRFPLWPGQFARATRAALTLCRHLQRYPDSALRDGRHADMNDPATDLSVRFLHLPGALRSKARAATLQALRRTAAPLA